MSEKGCYCGWGNSEIDLCPFCQKVEREREQELWDLRTWKEKARPFLAEFLDEYQSDSDKIDDSLPDGLKDFHRQLKNKAIATLTELLKEAPNAND